MQVPKFQAENSGFRALRTPCSRAGTVCGLLLPETPSATLQSATSEKADVEPSQRDAETASPAGSVRSDRSASAGRPGLASTPTGSGWASVATSRGCSISSSPTFPRVGGRPRRPSSIGSSPSGWIPGGRSPAATVAALRRTIPTGPHARPRRASRDARVRDPAERGRRGPGAGLRARRRRGLAWPGDRGPGAEPQRQDDAGGGAGEGGSRVLLGRVRGARSATGACIPSRSRCRSAARAAATCTRGGRAPRSSGASAGASR